MVLGSNPGGAGQEIVSTENLSRQALWSTQSPIHWVPAFFPAGTVGGAWRSGLTSN